MLDEGASVAIPTGWKQKPGPGRIILEPEQGGGRIDVGFARRTDFGVERTPRLVTEAIARQMPHQPADEVRQRIQGGEPVVATVDVVARDGTPSRAHHAVFLANSIIHVSCVGVASDVCDAVAQSVREGNR